MIATLEYLMLAVERPSRCPDAGPPEPVIRRLNQKNNLARQRVPALKDLLDAANCPRPLGEAGCEILRLQNASLQSHIASGYDRRKRALTALLRERIERGRRKFDQADLGWWRTLRNRSRDQKCDDENPACQDASHRFVFDT